MNERDDSMKMQEIIFGHDANFGFPFDEASWIDFFKKFNVKVVPYMNMDTLTEDLKSHQLHAAFLPATNDYDIRNDPDYFGIVDAVARGNQKAVSSILIVKKDFPAENVEQLRGKRLGYVHTHCTTTYMAPAILLKRHGFSIKNFFSELVHVEAYRPQIISLLAGEVDATMVQEDVWLKEARFAEETKILDNVTNLPTPVVIVSRRAPKEFQEQFKQELLNYKNTMGKDLIFPGFVPYNKERIEEFFNDAKEALA